MAHRWGAAPRPPSPPPLFVAVVHAGDDVRFAATATSRGALVECVAGYVRERAGDQLWPDGACEVRTLLDGGELDAAIERYFALVGARWDEEWLVTTWAEGADAAATSSRLGGVVDDRSGDGRAAAGGAIRVHATE